jgi:hypothetical protein
MVTDDTWDGNEDVMHAYCIKSGPKGEFCQKTGPAPHGKIEVGVKEPGKGIQWPRGPELQKYCCPSAIKTKTK